MSARPSTSQKNVLLAALAIVLLCPLDAMSGDDFAHYSLMPVNIDQAEREKFIVDRRTGDILAYDVVQGARRCGSFPGLCFDWHEDAVAVPACLWSSSERRWEGPNVVVEKEVGEFSVTVLDQVLQVVLLAVTRTGSGSEGAAGGRKTLLWVERKRGVVAISFEWMRERERPGTYLLESGLGLGAGQTCRGPSG